MAKLIYPVIASLDGYVEDARPGSETALGSGHDRAGRAVGPRGVSISHGWGARFPSTKAAWTGPS